MALTPDEFYAHARAATDADGRLPLARMTMWDVSPFEPDGLRVSPLRPRSCRRNHGPARTRRAV